jgi:hypothetical protein
MPEYLSPGVYVEEVPPVEKPIESVGTSTAGFVGIAEKGPVNDPQLITNWSQFTRTFGEFIPNSYLAYAVYGFFNNGGTRCYITRVEFKEGFSAKDLIGYNKGPKDRKGLGTFEAIDEISMVAIPDAMSLLNGKPKVDPAKKDDRPKAPEDKTKEVLNVQRGLMDHCAKMKDRFAVLDPLKGYDVGEIKKWRQDNLDSKYAALYYPWIEVADPIKAEGKPNRLVPPSGHMMGIYARCDATVGVHKAPANEIIQGVTGLEFKLTKGEQDILNPEGINCLRAFPGRGIRVWGARTVSSDASWRYINVRRLFLMVEESIENGTQWVIFEPNDQSLWKKITRNISAYLRRVWRDGALVGAIPQEAFYVKCDKETNPPEVVSAGQVVIEVGIAPIKPAEFVIFRITQKPQGAEVTE